MEQYVAFIGADFSMDKDSTEILFLYCDTDAAEDTLLASFKDDIEKAHDKGFSIVPSTIEDRKNNIILRMTNDEDQNMTFKIYYRDYTDESNPKNIALVEHNPDLFTDLIIDISDIGTEMIAKELLQEDEEYIKEQQYKKAPTIDEYMKSKSSKTSSSGKYVIS